MREQVEGLGKGLDAGASEAGLVGAEVDGLESGAVDAGHGQSERSHVGWGEVHVAHVDADPVEGIDEASQLGGGRAGTGWVG